MNATVGIFGGTFNPIHVGHLRAAEEVVEALDLERMVFVPSAEPPHKQTGLRDPIAPAALRHRILLNFDGLAEGVRTDDVVAGLLETVPRLERKNEP